VAAVLFLRRCLKRLTLHITVVVPGLESSAGVVG
jgi:hypothetical protein